MDAQNFNFAPTFSKLEISVPDFAFLNELKNVSTIFRQPKFTIKRAMAPLSLAMTPLRRTTTSTQSKLTTRQNVAYWL